MSNIKGKHILVTGGSGFIGSNLVDNLITEGATVCVIDKEEPGYRNPQTKYYIMDLASDKIDEVFKQEKIDIVIHLAAQTSVNISVENPKEDCVNNILALLNLLEYCKQYKITKIIAASSAAVYGEPKYLPVDEKHDLLPMSPYALSKFTMESYIKLSGLDYIIFRFSNVYGPRQSTSKESGVISIFTNNIINNRTIMVFGDGNQVRDFIYIKDIVDSITSALDFKLKNEIINLSSGTKTSINELIDILQDLTGNHITRGYLPSRTGDIKESVLDNRKMLSFGLKNKTPLKEGLLETIKFYKNKINKEKAENNILVIIPARGGSVGIPRKALRNLNGKPLIAYSIETALKSKFKLDVYVSSDDDEILYISQKIGAQVYKRNPEISDGATTLDPVIYDAYKNIKQINNKDYNIIITLQPTSPLLKTETLDNAIDKILNNKKIDTLISAKDTTHLSWSEKDGKFIPNYEKRVNRQFLKPIYTETGGFLITRDNVITETTRIGKNIELFVLKNNEETIDIDTYEDFCLANYYLKRKNILFVVSGYNKIGFGHIYRTLLLANQITDHNIAFLVTKDSEDGYQKLKQFSYKTVLQKNDNLIDEILKLNTDVVINDILNTDETYIKKLKEHGIKVINFEDIGNGAKYADLVINALYSEKEKTNNSYSGYEYFCARDEFILSKTKEITNSVKNILITFGGTDPNNLTEKVLNAIYDYCKQYSIDITVVLGLGYEKQNTLDKYHNINIFKDIKSMSNFMTNADLIFTACGRTVYEAACIGTPTIVMAQNERELKHEFASIENGFINLKLGKYVTQEKILQTTQRLISNFNLRKDLNTKMLSKNLKKGTGKVIKLILQTIGDN